MRTRLKFIGIGLLAGLLFNAVVAIAWTGPTGSPPNSNVSAPVNVGTTAQIKNGNVGVNNISAFGNALLSGLGVGTGRYLNFDYTSGGTSGTGSAGYGIRDNAGTLEFRNLGGAWASISTSIQNYLSLGTVTQVKFSDGTTQTTAYTAGGGGQWTSSAGGAIYYNGGNVGIGISNPWAKLTVYDASPDSARISVIGTRVGAWSANALFFGDEANGSRYFMNTRGTNESANANWRMYYYTTPPDSWQTTIGIYPTALNSTSYAMGLHNDHLYIDASGNVGIGTAGPNAKLNVVGTSNFSRDNTSECCAAGSYTISLAENTSVTSKTAKIQFHNANVAEGSVELANGGVRRIRFYDNQSSGLGIETTGNVGFGTAPQSDRRLYVNNPSGYGIVGNGPTSGSTYYGVYGSAGSANAGLGRADGYSFVGNGVSYNSGASYATSFLYISDRRLKENIAPLDQGLVTLMKLNPVSFTWKQDATGGRAGKDDIGFIAQEVENLIPEAVIIDTATGYKAVDYPKLIPILVKALQEEHAVNDAQQAEINALRGELRVIRGAR